MQGVPCKIMHLPVSSIVATIFSGFSEQFFPNFSIYWKFGVGYRNLNPAIEEGICQVLSYMWLESEVMPGFRNTASTSAASTSASSSSSSSSSKKGGRSPVENKIGEFFMHQIAHDTSSAYGEGFRAANKAVNTYGLRRTLDHIHMTGTLPVWPAHSVRHSFIFFKISLLVLGYTKQVNNQLHCKRNTTEFHIYTCEKLDMRFVYITK